MKLQYLFLSIVVAGIVGVGGLFYLKLLKWDDIKTLWRKIPAASVLPQTASSPKSYVAVYLTNGKVYFGKMENPDTREPVMSDVFFLNAVTGSPASTNEKGKEPRVVPAPQTEFQLIRLSDQFQAPVDRLTLTRDHILYWEELSDDSKVVQAIAKYHEGQK